MDSAPAGATRMGSRSSTRHGGPAQVFVGPVRKWRKVWSPVSSSSPSPSAARVVLFRWNPVTPSNEGAKEDSAALEERTPSPARPVKYLPVSYIIQRNKDEIAKQAAEAAEALAPVENESKEAKETTTSDMVVDAKESDSAVKEDVEKIEDPTPTAGDPE